MQLKELVRNTCQRISEITPLSPMAAYELDAVLTAAFDELLAAQRERDAGIAESFIPSGFRGNETLHLHKGTYHNLPLGDIVGITRDDRARVIAAAIRNQETVS